MRGCFADSVADLSHYSPNTETDTVANLGHSYKPNINKQGEAPTHEIFERNKKIQDAVNDLGAGVAKLVHIPSQVEVEQFFQDNNHPKGEAIKFFNHYKALQWKLQGKTPILDWKPLVEKWMQNAKRWNDKKQPTSEPVKDIQYLYDSFLQGTKIFKHILPEHFDQLSLVLTDDTLQNARSERINQVSGTNQQSLNDLWQAYLKNDSANELLLKDKPILIALAKRIAVIKHFHNLKNKTI